MWFAGDLKATTAANADTLEITVQGALFLIDRKYYLLLAKYTYTVLNMTSWSFLYLIDTDNTAVDFLFKYDTEYEFNHFLIAYEK